MVFFAWFIFIIIRYIFLDILSENFEKFIILVFYVYMKSTLLHGNFFLLRELALELPFQNT